MVINDLFFQEMGFLSEAGMQAMLGSHGDSRVTSRVSPEISPGDFWGWRKWTVAGEGLPGLLLAPAPLAHRNPSPCQGLEMGKVGRFVPRQLLLLLGTCSCWWYLQQSITKRPL